MGECKDLKEWMNASVVQVSSVLELVDAAGAVDVITLLELLATGATAVPTPAKNAWPLRAFEAYMIILHLL